MKIGIFSGTFDPIHDGHLALADNTAHQLGLDKVVLLVEPKPRRKQHITGYKHRLAMAKLATKDLAGRSSAGLKTAQPGPRSQKFISVHEAPAGDQHSVEHTLAAMKNLHPGSELVLIMGGDVFEYAPTWDDQAELKKLEFAVGLRTEDDGELAVSIAGEHGYRLKLIQTDLPAVSSSHLRQLIKSGAKPGHLHPDVYAYIKEHKLYDGS